MKITIIGSMTFVDKMIEYKSKLEQMGHMVSMSRFAEPYSKLPLDQIESQTIFDKNNNDGLKECCVEIDKSDAVLALNYDKRGINNYIGGNTFLELGYAFIRGKKIFFLKPVPYMLYTSELEAMKPIILNDNLNSIN